MVLVAAIGFNVETVQYNNIKFQVWDLGLGLLQPFLTGFMCFEVQMSLLGCEVFLELWIFIFLLWDDDRGANEYQVTISCFLIVGTKTRTSFS